MAKVSEFGKARARWRKRRERTPNPKIAALIDTLMKLSVLIEKLDGDFATQRLENSYEPDGAS